MGGSKVLVVGAGPVGALAAINAASRGDQVEVYELRGDLRDPSTTPLNFTRSINLAISERAINSLRLAGRRGLLESVFTNSIAMHGRMIHGQRQGKLFEESQPYDVHGRAIRAADRGGLNKLLLDELETMPNVKLFFNHKLTGADFKRNLAWFEQLDTSGSDHAQIHQGKRAVEIERSFDFMIGADGAHSAVRFHLMKFARMSYQQEYIDTLWCEFHIPPAKEGELSQGGFRLSPHHLHIWPDSSCMFIAIPSMDKSFTCTLFMPVSQYTKMEANTDQIVSFFGNRFPGVVPALIAPAELRKQYAENPHLPLISIKCTPYHYSSSAVILGDAAHAMVPFYGQGMNAGLEDVRILFEVLDKHMKISAAETGTDKVKALRAAALDEYTTQRNPDAHAINDLALRNYREMRSDVRSPLYLLRKRFEEVLYSHLPCLGIATQYSRVSFGNERYSKVERAAQRQKMIFLAFITFVAATLSGGTLCLLWHLSRKPQRFRPLNSGLAAILALPARLGWKR